MKYLDRIADKMLQLRLEAFGAVQIVGPKWCGKTTTAMQQGWFGACRRQISFTLIWILHLDYAL